MHSSFGENFVEHDDILGLPCQQEAFCLDENAARTQRHLFKLMRLEPHPPSTPRTSGQVHQLFPACPRVVQAANRASEEASRYLRAALAWSQKRALGEAPSQRYELPREKYSPQHDSQRRIAAWSHAEGSEII